MKKRKHHFDRLHSKKFKRFISKIKPTVIGALCCILWAVPPDISAQNVPPHYPNAVLKLYYGNGRYTYGVSQLYDDSINVGCGTITPTEKFDVVGGNIRTTGKLISLIPTGTAPLSVSSSTLISNLNSDMVDDLHASAFSLSTHTHAGMVTGAGTATQLAFWNGPSSLTGSTELFWDNASSRLGIGTSVPSAQLHIASTNAQAALKLTETFSFTNSTTTKSWNIANNMGILRFEIQTGNSTPYAAMTIQSTATNAIVNVNGQVNIKRLQFTSGFTANYLLATTSTGLVISKDPALVTGWTVSGNNVYKTNGAAAVGTTLMEGQMNIASSAQPALVIGANQSGPGYALLTKASNSQIKAFAVESGGTENFILWGNGYMQVDNKIRAKEVEVCVDVWHDDVFRNDYPLWTLQQIDEYISANGHLPGIPQESEVLKEGISLGKMNAALLEKVEELTLYVIALNKTNIDLQAQISELKTASKP